MNETIFRLVPDTLGEYLGVSSSVVTTVLLLCIAVSIAIVLYLRTASFLLSLLASNGVLIFGAFTGLLPLWIGLLTLLIGFGSVVFLRLGETEENSIDIKLTENPRDLILRIEKSSRSWPQYINNLDSLLGIVTINDENLSSEYGLKLSEQGELFIHQGYDWYITDKYPSQDLFKVVGLHKEDSFKNLVYLLGKSPTPGRPSLVNIPRVYLEGDLEECLLWPNVGI